MEGQPVCAASCWLHTTSRDRLVHGIHVVLVVAQLVCAVGTFTLPVFRREVLGSIPIVLDEHRINFDADITFLQLSVLAARGGGLNYLMATVFCLFNVVTPVLRSISLLVLLLIPLSRRRARQLYAYSKVVVAFYSHDVMIVATPLINITFAPMSRAMIAPSTVPACKDLDRRYDTGNTCLEVNVAIAIGYWMNVAAVTLMLLSGFDGSPTAKYIHRRLFPQDPRPPPSIECS